MTIWRTLDGTAPRIIAHRGASGLMPEHCVAGYELAIAQGADLIEPDLVASRDGVLIARHERELRRSTDVSRRPEWQSLAQLDGSGVNEWRADDFTAAQLASLRVIQPFPGRSARFDGQFSIPQWHEILALAKRAGRGDRWLGVYPELKHPVELLQQGIDTARLLIDSLHAHALTGAQSSVWVQCFDRNTLRRVHDGCGIPCFLLLERVEIGMIDELAADESWLSGIALPKSAMIGVGAEESLTRRVHDSGWQLHVWTLRDDSVLQGFSCVQDEYRALFDAGVDALFCDFPESAIAARSKWVVSSMEPL